MVRALPALPGALALVLLTVAPSAPVVAGKPPDLKPYPPAAPGERRWLISVDTSPAAEADQRVELIVGRTMLVDCNRHVLLGSIVEDSVPGWGYPLYRVKGGTPTVSTRMACPDQLRRRQFVGLGGVAPLVPVNPKLPIVVVAPEGLEVRWRLWRAEPGQRPAEPF